VNLSSRCQKTSEFSLKQEDLMNSYWLFFLKYERGVRLNIHLRGRSLPRAGAPRPNSYCSNVDRKNSYDGKV
jgi:hypothetical protein